MFDWIRNLTKSAGERQHEMLTAYVDDELSAADRARFEQMMAQDESLRAEMERQRQFKQAIQSLPRAAAPRNFILSKAEFQEAPAPQRAVQLYPVLRTATALAAVFVVIVIVAGTFSNQPLSAPVAFDTAGSATESDDSIALQSQPEAAPSDAEANRAVEEIVVEEAEELLEEEEMAEAEMAEESADEAMADDSVADDSAMESEPTDDGDADAADGESAFESPRPGEATEEPPRADDVAPAPEPTVVAAAPTVIPDIALTAPASADANENLGANEEQVTMPEGANEAPRDLQPLLVFAAIAIFLMLLGATLYIRYQKNNI